MDVLQNYEVTQLENTAKQQEEKYKWLEAIEFYEKAINLALKEDNSFWIGEIYDRIGYCYFRAALQAPSKTRFKNRMKRSVQTYEKAAKIYQNSEDKKGVIKAANSKAEAAYANSWLAISASKKKAYLDEWWILKCNVLKGYENIGDKYSSAKTCNDMLECSSNRRIFLESSWEASMQVAEELFSLGERAIATLSELSDNHELARAYCWTSWCYALSIWDRVRGEKRKELGKKAIRYSKKAVELSEKTGDAWLIGWTYNSAFSASYIVEGDIQAAYSFLQSEIKQGKILGDNYLLAIGTYMLFIIGLQSSILEEDPDKKRELVKRNLLAAQDASQYYQTINYSIFTAHNAVGTAFLGMASVESNFEEKQNLLKNAVRFLRKSMKHTEGWVHSLVPIISQRFIHSLVRLSEVESVRAEKKRLLEEALINSKKTAKTLQQIWPKFYLYRAFNNNWMALAEAELSKITKDKKKKTSLLKNAVSSMETCLVFIEKELKDSPQDWKIANCGKYYYQLGGILNQLYLLTRKEKLLHRTIEAYDNAIGVFGKTDIITHLAEARWQKAKVRNQLCEYLEAAQDYELSSKAYLRAAEKVPQLKAFYEDHASYMKAWSQIEQARFNHSIEEYNKAKQNYEKAAMLHKSTDQWSYLVTNYFAWASMEEAEGLSRKENTQQAKEAFQRALEQFTVTEKSIKQKIQEITSPEENKLNQRLLDASDLRRRFCQARIQIEEAKLLDREGKYLQSSKNYREAAQKLGSLIGKVESKTESKELELLSTLCQAWEKMAFAEETTSAESYLEAATLFEQAKGYCFTRKASLWAIGNSSFCKGLAAGTRYQDSMDLKENALAKRHMKRASTSYLQAGFRNASEYAKATQRLFDAYVFMNQAESEVDPEKKTKQYQMAENLLQIAAGSFTKAKQPEKTTQVHEILASVREEKTLAISLSQLMKAPSIASTTQSFTAPTPTSEVSVGLEQFQHANVQANLIAGMKEVKIGESFCLSIEFVNAGREPALLTRVEGFVPQDFIVVKKPEIYRLEESCLNMKGKQIAPLKLVEAKLVLQPSKKGIYQLNPKVHYLDERGQNKSLQMKTVEIKVEEIVLADRVSTGTKELDSLLLGGVPRNMQLF